MLSQKNVQMLDFLCGLADMRQYIRVEELALKFRVSARTVRYDLDNIDYYLKSNGYQPLERTKGAGIRINVTQHMLESIRATLSEMHVDAYVLSRQERALCIQLTLFTASAPMKYDQLAEELYVSRKTVIEDVRTLKDEEQEDGAHIRAAKNGIYYDGTEEKIREAALSGMLKFYSPLELWELGVGIYLNRSVMVEKKWLGIMENADAGALEELLRRTEDEQRVIMSDDQFYLTILLTALSRNRLLGGHMVTARDNASPSGVTAAFFRNAEQALDWGLPEAEMRYVLGEMRRILNESGRERAEKLAGIITENLLVRVSDEMSRKYFLDNGLRTGLWEHLVAVIRSGSPRRNEDDATIQAMATRNGRLFECVRGCLNEIIGLRLDGQEDAESALIALHFLAADERRLLTGDGAFKALVVCANGVGTSKIVSATVKKHFPQIRIIASTSIHNLETIIERNQPDFVLTTVPLVCRNTPIIQVNTLLSDSDLKRIRSFISANRKSGGEGEYRDICHEILGIVADTCDIRDRKRLEHGLMRVMGLEEDTRSGLVDLIEETDILVGLEADDWESAVRGSAKPLVEKGGIEPRYVQAMIDNIREMGPYIVIAPGIAMPHSLPKDGVRRNCLGVAVLKSPVEFGNEANDPVRIVLCMGAVDSHGHMKEISELISLFSDSEIIERCCAARSPSDVLAIIRTYNLS